MSRQFGCPLTSRRLASPPWQRLCLYWRRGHGRGILDRSHLASRREPCRVTTCPLTGQRVAEPCLSWAGARSHRPSNARDTGSPQSGMGFAHLGERYTEARPCVTAHTTGETTHAHTTTPNGSSTVSHHPYALSPGASGGR